MPDAAEILIAVPVMLLGSTVLSTVGFGIGITASPLLLLVLDPQTTVVMLNTASLALFALIIYQTRHHIRPREVLPIGTAGVLGVPVGVLALSTLSDGALRVGITMLVVAFTLSLRLNAPARLAHRQSAAPVIGLVVGTLLATSGIGGPLVVVYLLARGLPSQAVRGHLSAYFLMVQSVSVAGYAVSGLFTPERLWLIAIVAPPVLLGYAFGTVLVRRMDEARFRQGVIGVILVTSLVVLVREALRLQAAI